MDPLQGEATKRYGATCRESCRRRGWPIGLAAARMEFLSGAASATVRLQFFCGRAATFAVYVDSNPGAGFRPSGIVVER